MIRGKKIGGMVVLDPAGKPLVEVDAPAAPDGYELSESWEDNGAELVQTWALVPAEGTEADAVRDLARMLFTDLPDEEAYEVRALADPWAPVGEYAVGDRVLYGGELYRCLQAHSSQVDWTPVAAPSLWALVLPGQEGAEPEEGYAEWVQPGSTNGYSEGDRVTHDGHLWESLVDSNVDEPGTDNGFRWKDLGEYPPAASAAGAHFA